MFISVIVLLSGLGANAQSTETRVVLSSALGRRLILETTTPTTLEYHRCRIPARVTSLDVDPGRLITDGRCQPLGPALPNTAAAKAELQSRLTDRLMMRVAYLNHDARRGFFNISHLAIGWVVGASLTSILPSPLYSMTERVALGASSAVASVVAQGLLHRHRAHGLRASAVALTEVARRWPLDARRVMITEGEDTHAQMFDALERTTHAFNGLHDVFNMFSRALAYALGTPSYKQID